LWLCVVPAAAEEPSLAGKATIRRDAYGVPHILAESEEAAAFAHGYAAAEDHLGELARLFLRARGEEAAVFGERFLESDQNIQVFRILETARERFADLPPDMQAVLNGYAAGYDLYLSQNRKDTPAWATPITGVDLLAHCRAVLLLDFALNRQPWKQNSPLSGKGSNMWAIGGSKSKSGHGILLANPHLAWNWSNVFHEVHLSVPGKINVAGATLIGFPVVSIGFNEHLGWSHTVNTIDSDDVYELTLSRPDGMEYFYEGRLMPLKANEISVRVKTDQGVEVRKRRVLLSHYGPVIRVEGNKAYAYKSANLDLVNFLTQYNLMAKAANLDDFRSALNMQQLPMFSIAYADRAGNVFYVFNGRIPIRAKGFDWEGSVPGGRADTEWFAMHPLSELPQLLNPASGYVQNCNDAPWYANLEQLISKASFKDYITLDVLGARGQISLQFLSPKRTLTLEDVKQAKYNERELFADRVKSELIARAGSQKAPSPELAEAAKVLEAWDNRVARESRGAVLFMRWWEQYSRGAKSLYKEPWSALAPMSTPRGLGDADRAVSELALAAAAIRKEYGTLSVPWGDIYRLRRGPVDEPVGGAADGCFRSIRYRRDTDGKWIALGGDSYVLAVEFSDPPAAFSVMAYSESADPRSRHFHDQSALFARESYKPLWFTEQDIRKNLERAYHPGEQVSPGTK